MLASVHRSITKVLSEPITILLYAVIIGLGGGYGAVVFRWMITEFTFLFFHHTQIQLASYHGVRSFFVPIIGGLIVGPLVYFFAREAKGHGVPEVMVAITENKGIIRPRIVIFKALASAITLGSGGSVGREGPIVQIGSAWGSTFGQLFGVNERMRKTLVACGAAAGIAATFNAPIGGALFAFEIVLGSFELTNVSAIVISSVISADIGRTYFGNFASFPLPHYTVSGNFYILLLFAILGVLGGLYGVFYIRVLFIFEDFYDKLKKLPEWLKPASGGILIGIIGYFFPQLFGVGYPTVEKALVNHIVLGTLIVLLILKLVMTSLTLAAGGSGGVFAPGLFMGSMLGGAYGIILKMLFPHLPVSDGVFAAVGMAAVFAGSAHAPITAMVMLFEMTGNYQLILPLMLAAVIATAVSSKLSRESIYTMKLARRGLDILRKRNPDHLSSVLVKEAMQSGRLTIDGGMTLREALDTIKKTKEWFVNVKDSDGVILGSVARSQILENIQLGKETSKLQELLPPVIGTIPANATLSEASTLMNEMNTTYLLVMDENNVAQGVIGSSDIVRSYQD